MSWYDDLTSSASDAIDKAESTGVSTVQDYFDNIGSDPMVLVRDITSNPTIKQIIEGTPATPPPIAAPATKNLGILQNAVGVSMLSSKVAGIPMIAIILGAGALAYFTMKGK